MNLHTRGELLGDSLSLRGWEVADGDLGPLADEPGSRGAAQARRAARHETHHVLQHGVVQVYVAVLPTSSSDCCETAM